MTESCGTCRFFRAHVGVPDVGVCRRFAPRPLSGYTESVVCARWPAVYADEWCGEHEPEEAT